MDEEQRRFLEQRYQFPDWRELTSNGAILRNVTAKNFVIPNWTLLRTQSTGGAEPSIRSFWRSDADADEVLSVRLTECATAIAAHSRMIEELGNFEAPVIERRTGPGAIGDVTFALGSTMILFARANIVVLITNAGRKVVPVIEIAQLFDTLILRELQ